MEGRGSDEDRERLVFIIYLANRAQILESLFVLIRGQRNRPTLRPQCSAYAQCCVTSHPPLTRGVCKVRGMEL